MQTSKFSTMAMMNRNTQFKSLCQFPSKLFSWSTNPSATRCSDSYATTTAVPRIAPVTSKPISNIHGRFSFPSSFLQVSSGLGNLKLHVSRCNPILQDICFSTTQYKTTAGYKSVSVTKMMLNEARVKYYGSTGERNDSKEEVNADVDMNDGNVEDNQDSVGIGNNLVWTHWDSDNPPFTPTPPTPSNENEPDLTPPPTPSNENEPDLTPPYSEYNPASPLPPLDNENKEPAHAPVANENKEPAHGPPGNENKEPAHAPVANENKEPAHAPPGNENESAHAPAANENEHAPAANVYEPAHAPPANENEHAPATNENEPAHAPSANENDLAHAPAANEYEPAHAPAANENMEPGHGHADNEKLPDEDEIMKGPFYDFDTFKDFFDFDSIRDFFD